MKYKAFIFDLDDTLYCEHDYVRSGFYHIGKYLSNLNPSYSPEQIYHLLFDTWQQVGRGKVFNIVCEHLNLQVDIKELVRLYREHEPQIKLYEDAKKLLAFLKCKNVPMGLITDGNSKMQWQKVHALNIKEFMSDIVITDDFGGSDYWKPHILSYQTVVEKLEKSYKECVYIGDNPNKDFVSAKKLGLHTIRVIRDIGDHMQTRLEEDYEADRIIYSLSELINDVEVGQ